MPRKTMRRKRVVKRRYKRKTQATTRSHQLVIADRGTIRCRYLNITNPVLPAGAFPYNYKQFNLNGMWDVDPSILSTAMPGFSEWGFFYQYYRAVSCKITCQMTNTNTKPMYFMIWAETPNQPVPISWAQLIERSANPHSKITTLEVVGSNTTRTLTMHINFAKLLGDTLDYKADNQWRGGILSSNPPSIFNLYVAALNADALGVVTNGLPYKLQITYYADVFGRDILVA